MPQPQTRYRAMRTSEALACETSGTTGQEQKIGQTFPGRFRSRKRAEWGEWRSLDVAVRDHEHGMKQTAGTMFARHLS